jgi:hypothetical protein
MQSGQVITRVNRGLELIIVAKLIAFAAGSLCLRCYSAGPYEMGHMALTKAWRVGICEALEGEAAQTVLMKKRRLPSEISVQGNYYEAQLLHAQFVPFCIRCNLRE